MNTVNKYYCAICTYQTVMNTRMMVKADTPQEAVEVARVKFKDWNRKWMEDGGNEKRLIDIEVKKV